MDNEKKEFIVPMCLWIGTYVVRSVLYVAYGFELFHTSQFNLFLIWLGGIFFGLFMLKLVKYKKNSTKKLLDGIRRTPVDLVKAIYGNNPNTMYVDNILIGVEGGLQHYQHIFRDTKTDKMYSFHYATPDNCNVSEDDLKDVEVIEVKEVQRLVTVYERV